MAITKPQWKEIAEQLSRPYGRVELKCADRSVVFLVERIKPLKFGIITYIDGELRGEWVDEKSDVGKLFLCRRERFYHSPKRREAYIKAWGGKRCPKARRAEAEAKYVYHDVCWSSTSALRSHYTTHHPEAELVQVGHKVDDTDTSPMDKLKTSLSSMGLIKEDAP